MNSLHTTCQHCNRDDDLIKMACEMGTDQPHCPDCRKECDDDGELHCIAEMKECDDTLWRCIECKKIFDETYPEMTFENGDEPHRSDWT